MGTPVGRRDYLKGALGQEFPDYAQLLLQQKNGDRYLDTFIDKLSESISFMDDVDPYVPEPLKPMKDKIDGFLLRHGAVRYDDFLRGINPHDLHGGDFSLLIKRNLKRRLFDYRARIYLSALASCEEEEGLPLEELLLKVKRATVYPIKKEENEPTYDAILNLLQR